MTKKSSPKVKVTWVKQEIKLGRKKIDGWMAQIPEREDRFLIWQSQRISTLWSLCDQKSSMTYFLHVVDWEQACKTAEARIAGILRCKRFT